MGSPTPFARPNFAGRLNLTTKPLILARSLGRSKRASTPFTPKKWKQQTLSFTKTFTKSAYLCRRRLEQHVRVRRPIRADYELGNGVQAIRGGPADCLDAKPDPRFVKPGDTRFIHEEVGKFLEAYDASQLEMKFKAMGIYTHDDLVTVAVDIRNNQSLRQEFKTGLETTDEVWRRLKAGLYRYARPAKAPPVE
ncbi:hypothetical protein BDZ89DRAFT_1146746 [Hymenopellis radicata]|nr:hypothetical protein BDZ89DRAFT_1146746 [Hymenopellis radicata]